MVTLPMICTWLHCQAIEQFQLGLEFAPQNLAAQYGLASAMLGMSKECRALGAFGWAANLTRVKKSQNVYFSLNF
jgi:hypothetical protein